MGPLLHDDSPTAKKVDTQYWLSSPTFNSTPAPHALKGHSQGTLGFLVCDLRPMSYLLFLFLLLLLLPSVIIPHSKLVSAGTWGMGEGPVSTAGQEWHGDKRYPTAQPGTTILRQVTSISHK